MNAVVYGVKNCSKSNTADLQLGLAESRAHLSEVHAMTNKAVAEQERGQSKASIGENV